MSFPRCISSFSAPSLLLLVLLLAPQAALAQDTDPSKPCFVTADAKGNPILPPIECAYYPVIQQLHASLVDPVTGKLRIGIRSSHEQFRNIVITPGGTLGGTRETFDSTLNLEAVNGDGDSVTIEVPAKVVTDTSKFQGFRSAGGADGFQNLEADMRSIRVEVHNHPCFAFLEIIGGTANGLPSPGNITLNPQGEGTWIADSSFNISIRVTYIGSEEGPFAGQSGTFEGTVTVEAAGL